MTVAVNDATAVAVTAVPASVARGRRARRLRWWKEAGALGIAVLVLIWTLVPVYNIFMVSLESKGDVFTETIWPARPSLDSFWIVITQGYWYLEEFWHQFANSVYIGVGTVFFTLAIGSLASFAIGRMRIRYGWLLSNAALLTYVIPASFLAIPFYRIMQIYGLTNNLWSVIAAEVTFATPYAIFIFQQYGTSIPIELDEAARIDGASPFQVYWKIYLGRHLRPAAGMERVPLSVPVAVLEAQHERAGGTGAVPQQRRGALELHDGDGDRVRDPAGRNLLRVPPPHVRRPHHGRGQGLNAATLNATTGRT